MANRISRVVVTTADYTVILHARDDGLGWDVWLGEERVGWIVHDPADMRSHRWWHAYSAGSDRFAGYVVAREIRYRRDAIDFVVYAEFGRRNRF